MIRRNSYRKTVRSVLRRTPRRLSRSCLRGRRGPDDFAQMLTAYARLLRAHRRLARLAPSFFDAAVVARERENRAEQRRWLALWEPLLAKAYGVAPEPAVDRVEWPPLPPPATQRAVDRQLAEVQLWIEAAHAAGERHQRRQPHALPSLTRLARLLQLAFDLKKVVLGLDSKNPLPEKITCDYEFTDLKRAYGHLCSLSPSDPGLQPANLMTESDSEPGSAQKQRSAPESADAKPTSPPNTQPSSDEKRDVTPHRLVIGSHGLLCLEPF